MSPNEIIVRWFVNWLCGFLAAHGMPGFDQDSIVGAVTTDVIAYGIPCLLLARALYTSGVTWVTARLQARHKEALLAAAAGVPGVEKIVAEPSLAAATPSDKVVPPSGSV